MATLAAGPAIAADTPATQPATKPAPQHINWTAIERAQLQKWAADLKSGDADLVASTITAVKAHACDPRVTAPSDSLQLLLDADKPAEAGASCVDAIITHPGNAQVVTNLQRLRVKALLAEKKTDEALSAAKAFFDVAPLKQTGEAITMVSLCLTVGRPQDRGIVRRFKRQQLLASATQPSTQPSEDLGDPILPAIPVDGTPFEKAVKTVRTDDYTQFVAKGNLLLVSGRAKEAHEVFEQAYELAEGKQMTEAIENVARAVRAENNAVGPANAYILSLRDKAQ